MLKKVFEFFKNENEYYGGDDIAHIIALSTIALTVLYYLAYYLITQRIRRKTIVRNPEIEKIAFKSGLISNNQLMIKYSANLSASSTMAALSVTMVLLSVAALLQIELEAYDNFIAVMLCILMTIASIALLFAHELYDAIINPLFETNKRFTLRELGSNFQASGLILFIVSMLLAISTVSIIATIVSSISCCVVMTLYIEQRLVSIDKWKEEIQIMINSNKSNS